MAEIGDKSFTTDMIQLIKDAVKAELGTNAFVNRYLAEVTGLEAANLVIQQFSHGNMAQILPIEADEPHIRIARSLNQNLRNLAKSLIPSFS